MWALFEESSFSRILNSTRRNVVLFWGHIIHEKKETQVCLREPESTNHSSPGENSYSLRSQHDKYIVSKSNAPYRVCEKVMFVEKWRNLGEGLALAMKPVSTRKKWRRKGTKEIFKVKNVNSKSIAEKKRTTGGRIMVEYSGMGDKFVKYIFSFLPPFLWVILISATPPHLVETSGQGWKPLPIHDSGLQKSYYKVHGIVGYGNM